MIVFCHLLNDFSGSPAVLRSSIAALKRGSATDVLYVGDSGTGALSGLDMKTIGYRYRRCSNRVLTLLSYVKSQLDLFRTLTKASDIPSNAIVFVNTLLPFGAAIWGRRTGRTVVIHIHEVSISPPLLRWFLKVCAGYCADTLIYVSADQLRRLPIRGPQARVVPNCIDPALAKRATEYSVRRTGKFVVLMLASLKRYKGVQEFIELASGFSDREDIEFRLVLNAAGSSWVEFARSHSSVANLSVFSGTDNPGTHYEVADLVVNLSRVDQWIETFGLTLLEAMTYGIPVIGPPVGGPTELITHGREGYCIDSRDAAALREAVSALADDAELALAMSRAGRSRSSDFTFDVFSTRLRAEIFPFM